MLEFNVKLENKIFDLAKRLSENWGMSIDDTRKEIKHTLSCVKEQIENGNFFHAEEIWKSDTGLELDNLYSLLA